jgi:HSP20 family protein
METNMKEQGIAAQPAREVSSIKKEVGEILDRVQNLSTQIARRAYEIFEENGRKVGLDLAHWFQAEAELLHPIHLRVSESPEAITVRAEVPGFGAKDLEVSIEPWRLIITGKREAKEVPGTVCFERCPDRILRVVDLLSEVNAGKALATLKNGILEVVMPKVSVAKKVPIESAKV